MREGLDESPNMDSQEEEVEESDEDKVGEDPLCEQKRLTQREREDSAMREAWSLGKAHQYI